MRVLVVEDNEPVAESIRMMLEVRQFAANVVTDGEAGLDHLLRRCYDAAVVDVGLPGLDGFTLARQARAEGVQTPILMLTARDAVEDRVAGLDCGADDYLVKPFVEEELIARITAILRRGDRPMVGVVQVGALRIDLAGRNVTYDGEPVLWVQPSSGCWSFWPVTPASRYRERKSSSASGITISKAPATSSTST